MRGELTCTASAKRVPGTTGAAKRFPGAMLRNEQTRPCRVGATEAADVADAVMDDARILRLDVVRFAKKLVIIIWLRSLPACASFSRS